ncbi:MAG TPA: hypothetical protein GXX36_11825 [Clostridiaceae bacterium]|nr:hypothetical protein [Clostridiaceae bacterium]
MRKLHFMKLLLMILICVLTGCSNNAKSTEQNIPVRAYVMQESEEPVKPTVLLEDSNRFTFICKCAR